MDGCGGRPSYGLSLRRCQNQSTAGDGCGAGSRWRVGTTENRFGHETARTAMGTLAESKVDPLGKTVPDAPSASQTADTSSAKEKAAAQLPTNTSSFSPRGRGTSGTRRRLWKRRERKALVRSEELRRRERTATGPTTHTPETTAPATPAPSGRSAPSLLDLTKSTVGSAWHWVTLPVTSCA